MTVNYSHNKKRGFTLIETLVAVLILAAAVTGPLSIASRALNNSIVAKDQISAFFLAQDAVEYARFVRDSNSLKGDDWLTGALGSGSTEVGVDLTPCISTVNANGCYLDSTMAVAGVADAPTACDPSSGCPVMSYDGTNSRFTYASGSGITKSLFTRKIVLTRITDSEYELTVTITWADLGSTVRRVQVYENIFKWQ